MLKNAYFSHLFKFLNLTFNNTRRYTFFYRERQNREHGPILGQKIENNYFEIENNAGPPNQIDPQMS